MNRNTETNRIKIVLCVAVLLFSVQIFGQAVNCNQGDQNPKVPDPPVMDSLLGDSTNVDVNAPVDPNEIIGTRGYDALDDAMQWVAAMASWPYTNILILQEKL